MNLEDRIKEEKELLEKRVEQLKLKIADAPDGSLHFTRQGNSIKYYHSITEEGVRKRSYISKSDISFIRSLLLKKFWSWSLDSAQNELSAIQAYLDKHISDEQAKASFQKSFPPESLTLLGNSADLSRSADDWQNASYEKLTAHPEQKMHKTARGELVRSKSEVIIANCLYKHHIPYRYENQLLLGGAPCYPDFTILHPSKNCLYIWEHFGLMDQHAYRERSIEKLNNYMRFGYTPSMNLICTYESSKTALSGSYVEMLVRHHFT